MKETANQEDEGIEVSEPLDDRQDEDDGIYPSTFCITTSLAIFSFHLIENVVFGRNA